MQEQSSIINVFDRIKVTTFALQSKDDALFTDEFTPKKQAQSENSKVFLASTDYGMHACHITGWLIPTFWSPVPCMEFLKFMESKKQLMSLE